MDDSPTGFATAIWDGSDVSCLAVPRSCACKGVAVHLDKILSSDKLLVQQYDPTQSTADGGIDTMLRCVGPETTVLNFPPADAPKLPEESRAARRKRLRQAESLCIYTLTDECILVIPKGIDAVLPRQFRSALAGCAWFWVAQYDRELTSLGKVLLTLTSDKPDEFPVDFTIISMSR